MSLIMSVGEASFPEVMLVLIRGSAIVLCLGASPEVRIVGANSTYLDIVTVYQLHRKFCREHFIGLAGSLPKSIVVGCFILTVDEGDWISYRRALSYDWNETQELAPSLRVRDG